MADPPREVASGVPTLTVDAPSTAPSRTREILRIIREPFPVPTSPTMGPDRWPPRLSGTQHRGWAAQRQWRSRSPFSPNRRPCRDRLSRQDELPDFDADPLHARQNDIIAAAGVDDQELPVGPVRARKGDPAVRGRGDEGARPRARSRGPFPMPPNPSGAPKALMIAPATGSGKSPLASAKGDRRREPRRILERRAARLAALVRRCAARRPARWPRRPCGPPRRRARRRPIRSPSGRSIP